MAFRPHRKPKRNRKLVTSHFRSRTYDLKGTGTQIPTISNPSDQLLSPFCGPNSLCHSGQHGDGNHPVGAGSPGRSPGAAAGVEPGRLGSPGPRQSPFLCHHRPGKPALGLPQLFESSNSCSCSWSSSGVSLVRFSAPPPLPPPTTKPLFCSINVILVECNIVVGELLGTEPWD